MVSMQFMGNRRWLFHLAALLLFIVLAYAYLPGLLQGRRVNQSDDAAWRAVYHEAEQYKAETGEDALWTDAIFGGMPTTTIALSQRDNFLAPINRLFSMGAHPASDMIIAMVGFYLLLLVFGVDPWLAIVGAVAFTFCSYNVQIIAAGHNTKLVAIAYMPWVVAGFTYAFRGRALFGAVLFGVALSLELLANHPQVTYYLAFALLFYAIYEFVVALRSRTLPKFCKTVVLLLLGAVLAFGSNANRLWPTWDYAKYTMRGGSEIAEGDGSNGSSGSASSSGSVGSRGGGLELSYATAWSYGIGESWNMLIPNFKGGASAGELSTKSESYKVLRSNGIQQPDRILKSMPLYWGDQLFTAGPMYMGAVTIFLFLFAILYFRGAVRWVLVTLSLLVLLLGWGSHFMPLTEFFHSFVPLYNKFRVPSMILILFELVMPLVGIVALSEGLSEESPKGKQYFTKRLTIAAAVTGGLCLLFALIPSLSGDFSSAVDKQIPDFLADALRVDRRELLRMDAMRSFLFIALAFGAILLYTKGKLKRGVVVAALGVLVLVDLWSVDKRYLNDDNLSATSVQSAFRMRPVDREILKDEDISYRVLDLSTTSFPTLSTSTIREMVSAAFNNSIPAYYHKLTGGYSAAKMQRYQDMIDIHLTPEISNMVYSMNIGSSLTPEILREAVRQGKVMNMLNTKYFVFNDNVVVENVGAMGNAWFVNGIYNVSTPREEIEAIKIVEPEGRAVIGADFADKIERKVYPPEDDDYIKLTSYTPNELKYEYGASGDRFALFSEVYYPGWVAKIDGESAEVLRADYILRGMVLPEGEHTITMSFEPDAYKRGGHIAIFCSSLLLFLFAGLLIYYCGTALVASVDSKR